MKKLALLLTGLTVGMAVFTSCTKTCHCKVYVADEVKYESERPLEKSVYEKCSDIGFIVMDKDQKYGEACE
jgi:hypothetical protein